jgi:hypothetical protein
MNKNTTTRLTDAEIHQLKYPKAQIVDVDIFEDETLSEQEIMAMVDQQHLNTLKKALGQTMELSTVLQNAEEARKGLMNFDLCAHPTIEGINSCIRICERAIEVLTPAIAVADELKVLYECNLGLHPRQIEEGKSIRTALIECKKFFEEEIKKLNWQMNFVESANATQKSSSKPRNIKPKVVVAKAEDMTYPYDGELTRTVYNYLAETKRLTANWDVFNNAVMCGNYAQLDTPANAKAQLCQIIHLFDIYICGGLYGHNAANSIGLSGRTNLTQQASNLPDNFKVESEQIFRQWAKKQSRK